MTLPLDPSHESEYFDDSQLVVIEGSPVSGERPTRSAKELLQFMIARQRYYGSPLPDGFVPPPGIDLQELLKQLPPPPENPKFRD
jgi:hypothetical protein